jgi:hypothetical protein
MKQATSWFIPMILNNLTSLDQMQKRKETMIARRRVLTRVA